MPTCGTLSRSWSVAVSNTKRSRSGTSGSRTTFFGTPGRLGLVPAMPWTAPAPKVHWEVPFALAQMDTSDWLPDSNAAT